MTHMPPGLQIGITEPQALGPEQLNSRRRFWQGPILPTQTTTYDSQELRWLLPVNGYILPCAFSGSGPCGELHLWARHTSQLPLPLPSLPGSEFHPSWLKTEGHIFLFLKVCPAGEQQGLWLWQNFQLVKAGLGPVKNLCFSNFLVENWMGFEQE